MGKALARLEEILRSGNDLEMTLISIGVAVASLAVGTLARKFWVWKRSASSTPGFSGVFVKQFLKHRSRCLRQVRGRLLIVCN